MELSTPILLIPATVIASVVLVVSCLSFKRFKKKRNESVADKSKEGKETRDENRQINGLTNTAFTLGSSDPDIYENDENIYDYATHERGVDPKLWLKSTGRSQDKHPDLSPMYSDANDTNTRFYFTLERNPTAKAEITDKDDESYVIVIPDNICDKPEDDTSADESLRFDTNEGGSQFYHTLEECCEQTEEQNWQNTECRNEKQGDISIGIEERDEMDNEDTYVIAIPDEENRGKYEISEEDAKKVRREAQTENEDFEQEYVDNISNQENSWSRMNDVHLGQIGIEEGHGYLGQLETDEDNSGAQQRINSESTRDELGDVKYESEEIYENFSVCFSESQDNLSANSSRVKIPGENTTTVDSQDNLGYLDDETLGQNKTNYNDENNYVIQIEPTGSDSNECSSKNTKENEQRYFDDDIYEDWEDNIITRGRTISRESGEDLNEHADEELAKIGGEDYHVVKEQDQSSRCESFYQNLNVYKPPLVMQS